MNQHTKLSLELKSKLEDIVELLKSGKSLSEISIELGYGYAGLYNTVKKSEYSHLLSIKNNGKSKTSENEKLKRRKLTNLDIENAYKKYLSGYNLYEICTDYKVSPSGLFTIFKRHGLIIRNKSEAVKNMYERYPEKRENMRQLSHQGKIGYPTNTRRKSSLEIACEDWLKSHNIEFNSEFRINDYGHSYDFRVGNILIEMDGEYWHSRERQIELDKQFEYNAQQHGFTVIRITDKEIKNTNGQIFNEKLGVLLK